MALIIPEVYASLVKAKFIGKVKVANLSTNLGILTNSTVGETVTFPKYSTLSDVQLAVKGVVSPIDSMNQTSSQATIKMYDKIVRVYDIDNMTALGSLIEASAEQEATLFARRLDTDLIAEALLSPLKVATADVNKITAAELNQGLAMYGDEADVDDIGGIVVNSLLDASFFSMDEFVSTGKTYNAAGNGIVKNGVIGTFRGIEVTHSDKGTLIGGECVSFIIKKGSLGYMEKKAIDIVEEREEKLHASDIVGAYVFAAKLMDETGVVVLRKTIV